MRIRAVVACGAVALLGGACGGGAVQAGKPETPSVSAAPASPATPTAEAFTAKASDSPTAAEVKAIVTSMTASLAQTAAGGPERPAPTAAEIEADLLEQLRQLGVPL
jgi:hypothetical protein